MAAVRDLQELRRRRRPNRRFARGPAGRGPRAARRERRRQVDADGRRLRRHRSPTPARSTFAGADHRRCSTPALANSLGIAIVHQHPALLPDMTVAENIRVAVPPEPRFAEATTPTSAMRALLDDVGLTVHLERPRRRPQRRPAAPAGGRQGAGRLPEGADPRRADRPARPGVRRPALRAGPDRRRRGHRGRLHHPPAGRGARARRPGDGPARRQASAAPREVDEVTDDELLA